MVGLRFPDQGVLLGLENACRHDASGMVLAAGEGQVDDASAWIPASPGRIGRAALAWTFDKHRRASADLSGQGLGQSRIQKRLQFCQPGRFFLPGYLGLHEKVGRPC